MWFRAPVIAKRFAARPFVWLVHVALPVLGLWLLIADPPVDHELMWEQQSAHFWLVLGTAIISSALAVKAALEARRHQDARLFLVAVSFLVAAGFLGLHALGTPTVLVDLPNTGFVLATPFGLTLAVIPAVASAMVARRGSGLVVRAAPAVLVGTFVMFALWAVWSLARWAPLDGQPTVEQHRSDFAAFVVPAAMLYCGTAIIYFLQYLKRPSMVLLSVLTAFVLLAEAAVATLVGRNWEASWWTWHILMTIAFALVAYGVLVEYSREGSTRSLFRAVTLDETLARYRHDYATALDTLVRSVESGEEGSVERAAASLADRFELSDSQVQLLAQAADALGHERERIRRLGALAAIAREVSVVRTEAEVVAHATEHLRAGFAPDQVVISLDPRAVAPPGSLAVPLSVKGHPAGMVHVTHEGKRPHPSGPSTTRPCSRHSPGSSRSRSRTRACTAISTACSGSTCRPMSQPRCWPIRARPHSVARSVK